MEALSYQIIGMHSSKKCRSLCTDRLREQISLPVRFVALAFFDIVEFQILGKCTKWREGIVVEWRSC